jgi:hypothetical protein
MLKNKVRSHQVVENKESQSGTNPRTKPTFQWSDPCLRGDDRGAAPYWNGDAERIWNVFCFLEDTIYSAVTIPDSIGTGKAVGGSFLNSPHATCHCLLEKDHELFRV